MARKKHFLAGLGDVAISAADRWWEKEKAKATKYGVTKKEVIDGAIDSNNVTNAVMTSDMMGY